MKKRKTSTVKNKKTNYWKKNQKPKRNTLSYRDQYRRCPGKKKRTS